jgi:hypothetical protein
MSPEFRDREKDGGACGLEICSCHVRGSCGAGAWALRPQRLQWLNQTSASGFKIAAFRKRGSQSFRARWAFAPILHQPQNSGRRQAWPKLPQLFSFLVKS